MGEEGKEAQYVELKRFIQQLYRKLQNYLAKQLGGRRRKKKGRADTFPEGLLPFIISANSGKLQSCVSKIKAWAFIKQASQY